MADNRGVIPRAYAPEAEKPGDLVPLPEDESAHLTRVLRLEAGAAVRVFNGRGAEFDARIDGVERGHVHVRVGASREPAAEPGVAVTLAQAALKGDKMDDVVRDAVMMGVAAIQPVVSARSAVSLAALERGHRVERWVRIAISSVKQCGRATVPRILPPRSFADVTTALGAMTLPGPGLMFVEPSAAAGVVPLGELATATPRETTLLIGPEGGWAAEEIERGSSACRLVTLGGRTLRADATAVVALAALFAVWKEI